LWRHIDVRENLVPQVGSAAARGLRRKGLAARDAEMARTEEELQQHLDDLLSDELAEVCGELASETRVSVRGFH
jgi:hypothetical protein